MWLRKSKQKEQEEFGGSDDETPSARSSQKSRGGKRGGHNQNRIQVLGYKPFSKYTVYSKYTAVQRIQYTVQREVLSLIHPKSLQIYSSEGGKIMYTG